MGRHDAGPAATRDVVLPQAGQR